MISDKAIDIDLFMTLNENESNLESNKKRQNQRNCPIFARKKNMVNPNMLAEKRITTFSASNDPMNLVSIKLWFSALLFVKL